MTRLVTVCGRPHLRVAGRDMPLKRLDIGPLVSHLRYIELWEPLRGREAHHRAVRLSTMVITTSPGEIQVTTKTGVLRDRLDPEALADALVAADFTNLGTLRACEACGTTIDGTHGRRFCAACTETRKREDGARRRAKRRLAPRSCTVCGTRFQPHHGRHSTCSPVCGEEQRRVRRASQRPQRVFPVRDCVICGESFSQKRATTITCSRECSRLNGLRGDRERRAKTRVCATCRKPLALPRVRVHPECRKGMKTQCRWCGRSMPPTRGRPLHPDCVEPNDRALAMIGVS